MQPRKSAASDASDSRREEARRWRLGPLEPGGLGGAELMLVSEHEAELARLSLPDPEKDRLRAIEKLAWEACEAEFTSERLVAMDRLRSALSEPSPGSERLDNIDEEFVDDLIGLVMSAPTNEAARERVWVFLDIALGTGDSRATREHIERNGLSEPSPSSGESEGQA